MFRALRYCVVTLSAVSVVGAPTVSRACGNCHGHGSYAAGSYAMGSYAMGSYAVGYAGSYVPEATYYATAYAPSCVAQTACYAPQTTYRPVVVNVPVAGYQTEIVSDPCTGCPVTVMRPVTTYVQQVQYAPVTTYRPVGTPPETGSPRNSDNSLFRRSPTSRSSRNRTSSC